MYTPTEALDNTKATVAGAVMGLFGLVTTTGEVWTIPGQVFGLPLNPMIGLFVLIMGLWFCFPRQTKRLLEGIRRTITAIRSGDA